MSDELKLCPFCRGEGFDSGGVTPEGHPTPPYPCPYCELKRIDDDRIAALERELATAKNQRDSEIRVRVDLEEKCRWYDELIEVIYADFPDGMNERPDPRELVKMWRDAHGELASSKEENEKLMAEISLLRQCKHCGGVGLIDCTATSGGGIISSRVVCAFCYGKESFNEQIATRIDDGRKRIT